MHDKISHIIFFLKLNLQIKNQAWKVNVKLGKTADVMHDSALTACQAEITNP